MNEPSDPQRPTGGDRPRETAAFEDTEFSFGETASRHGYQADVVENGSADAPTGACIIDADVVDDHTRTTPGVLGSTADPEMTGIIPAVRDTSERPVGGQSPLTGTAVGTAPPVTDVPSGPQGPGDGGHGDAGDGGDDDGDGNDGEPGSFSFRSLPPWAWVLGIGLVLAVIVGVFTASLMRHNSVTDTSPATSVVPSYARPSAWDSTTASPKPSSGGSGAGVEPYSGGDQSWSGDSGGTWSGGDDQTDTSGTTTDDGAGTSTGETPATDGGDAGTTTPGGDTGGGETGGNTGGETGGDTGGGETGGNTGGETGGNTGGETGGGTGGGETVPAE